MRQARLMIGRDHFASEFILASCVAGQRKRVRDFVIWGGAMSDHVHNWYQRGYGFFCTECHESLTTTEAMRRLNATERLSAEDALWSAEVLNEATNDHGVNQAQGRKVYYLTQVHEAYASALEGNGD